MRQRLEEEPIHHHAASSHHASDGPKNWILDDIGSHLITPLKFNSSPLKGTKISSNHHLKKGVNSLFIFWGKFLKRMEDEHQNKHVACSILLRWSTSPLDGRTFKGSIVNKIRKECLFMFFLKLALIWNLLLGVLSVNFISHLLWSEGSIRSTIHAFCMTYIPYMEDMPRIMEPNDPLGWCHMASRPHAIILLYKAGYIYIYTNKLLLKPKTSDLPATPLCSLAAKQLKNQQCICKAFSVKWGTQACNKKLCANKVGHSAAMVPAAFPIMKAWRRSCWIDWPVL